MPAQPARPAAPTAYERMLKADSILQSTRQQLEQDSASTASSGGSDEMYLSWINQRCNIWGVGTVKYRECRGRVWRELKQACIEANWRAQQYGSSSAAQAHAQQVCYAERHFRIID